MKVTRWFATALIMALVAGLWASPSATAAKSWSPLQLSWQGHHWANKLNYAMFRKVVLIPGETQTRSFYVRNRSRNDAVMLVKVQLNDASHLAASRDFRLAVGHHGHWVRIKADGSRGARFVVPQGGTDQIQARVKLLPTANSTSQLRSFSFSLKLRLTQRGR